MEKLELKHLVGYLPYGLRIANPKNKNHSRVIMHLKGRHLNESGLIEGTFRIVAVIERTKQIFD